MFTSFYTQQGQYKLEKWSVRRNKILTQMLRIISTTVKTRRALGEYKTLHPISKKMLTCYFLFCRTSSDDVGVVPLETPTIWLIRERQKWIWLVKHNNQPFNTPRSEYIRNTVTDRWRLSVTCCVECTEYFRLIFICFYFVSNVCIYSMK